MQQFNSIPTITPPNTTLERAEGISLIVGERPNFLLRPGGAEGTSTRTPAIASKDHVEYRVGVNDRPKKGQLQSQISTWRTPTQYTTLNAQEPNGPTPNGQAVASQTRFGGLGSNPSFENLPSMTKRIIKVRLPPPSEKAIGDQPANPISTSTAFNFQATAKPPASVSIETSKAKPSPNVQLGTEESTTVNKNEKKASTGSEAFDQKLWDRVAWDLI